MDKVQKAINLSGKMSKLGVTKLSDGVLATMADAAKSFYVVEDLRRSVEREIAEKFGASKAYVTNSASSAIFLTVAAVRLKANLGQAPLKVALPVMHHIDYGAPIRSVIELGGAEIIATGSSNQLTMADLEDSLAKRPELAVYVSSHHVPSKPSLSVVEYCNFYAKHQVPCLIDAAAEEDIWRFAKTKAEFVIVSGSKAIAGPGSGFVLYNTPRYEELFSKVGCSIGRVAKITKENIAGLATAIREYELKSKLNDVELNASFWAKRIAKPGLKSEIAIEESRGITRIRLSASSAQTAELNARLKKRGIYVRDYGAKSGYLELDLRQVTEKEMAKAVQTIESE